MKHGMKYLFYFTVVFLLLGIGFTGCSSEEKKEYFLSSEKFYKLCRENGDIYCVTQYKDRLEELKKHIPHADIIWSNNVYYLLRLHC